MKKIIRNNIAYIAAAAIFAATALIYCAPQLGGKIVSSKDDVNATAAVTECYAYHQATGDYSWWTTAMYCGMPNYQIGGAKYKSDELLSPIKGPLLSGRGNAAMAVFIYFCCFFILMRSLRIGKWLSIVGALATGLSSYFLVIIATGHDGKAATIALMSVVLSGLLFILRGKYKTGAVLTMIFTAAGFALHPQMSYYIFMLCGVMWIAAGVQMIKKKQIKQFSISTAIFVVSVLIGLGTGSSNIFANKEYVGETVRGKGNTVEYATDDFSYGIDESLSLLIPGVKGGASRVQLKESSKLYNLMVSKGQTPSKSKEFCQLVPMYWGRQEYTAGNVYVGAIICFLFILGIITVKGPYKWALLTATALSIMLSWGSNFAPLSNLFFKYFPLYNKFRAVSSILIVAEISIPLLGMLALSEFFKTKQSKPMLIAAAITCGICLLTAIIGSIAGSFKCEGDANITGRMPGWLYEGIKAERKHLLVSDSLRSIGLTAAAAVTLYVFSKGKLKQFAATAIIGVLITTDLFSVDKRYFNKRNFDKPKAIYSALKTEPYEEAIGMDKSYFRVFNTTTNTWNEARTSAHFRSLGGYNAARLKRYQDLIDVHLTPGHSDVINMLNAKYIIARAEDGKPAALQNPEAMGNAWFVGEVLACPDDKTEINALTQIDLHTQAVVSGDYIKYADSPGMDPNARVELTAHSPKTMDYRCSSEVPGTIVFSEIFYPYGWKATVDGRESTIFRADYTLRAINVPAGEHDIHFEFDPQSIKKGNAVATAFIILMYVVCAGLIACGIITTFARKDNRTRGNSSTH